jgi:hypothetical protein
MNNRCLRLAAIVLILSGCTRTVASQPSGGMWSPVRVAGMSIADGPSGLRPDAPLSRIEVSGSGGGPVDRLAAAAVDDVQEFWSAQFPALAGHSYVPVRKLV